VLRIDQGCSHFGKNDLLDLLRCPETGLRLSAAPADLVSRLQAALKAGTLKTRSGNVPEPFESALMTQDGSRIYPIREGIPVLMISEAL
jgi:uncharacterized protein YbaR (Trm112 family)